jgi:protein AATF/BFR2
VHVCVACREAAAVRAEGEQQLMAAAAGGDRQAAKAAGVRAQQRLWGSALEMRIRLQKAVSGANRLPRPAAAAAFKASNSAVADSYQQLRSACQETLESMLQLHDALAQQHPAAAAALEAAAAAKQQQQPPAAAAAAAGSKRSLAAAGLDAEPGAEPSSTRGKYTGSCSTAAAAWAAVDSTIESLAGFRDASLDKWHRRTVLSSGTAALRGSSGLRALQQSISTQVGGALGIDSRAGDVRLRLTQQSTQQRIAAAMQHLWLYIK